MATIAVSPDEPLALREIVVQDIIALQKWGQVVDHIVPLPADVLGIKRTLKGESLQEAVLNSLRLFYSRGGSRSELADVLQLESIGLNALAERIQEPPTRSSAGAITTPQATSIELWAKVGRVVENFSGRAVEVENTVRKLRDAQVRSRESGAVSIVSISGLGGVGKSTLARKYAFTHRDFYDGNVAWINAETIESMRASFIRLAKGLGLQLGDQPPQEFLVEEVFGYYNDRKCLFIYDNVENLAEFRQFLPKAVNPNHVIPYVLVTSRRTDLNSLPANEIHLDVLATEEAVELIQKMLPRSGKDYAMKLANKLQRLPLALQQALAYIRATSVGDQDEAIVEYLGKFDILAAVLLGDERFKDHDDYSSTTFATWQVTLARVKAMKDDGPYAIKVIKVLAYLNPDFISMELVKLLFDDETSRALNMLQRFSMIHVSEGNRVVIHRLVQHVRLSLSEQEEEKQLQTLVAAINGEFGKWKLNDLSRECMSHGLHLFPFQMKHTHSEAMTGNYYYFANLCNYLNDYGNYAEVLSISQQMASLYESIHGEKHGSTIRMKWRMADAYYFLDKFADSLQIANAILPTAKSVLGTQHSVTMNIQSRLGNCLIENGDSRKAVQMFNEIIPVAARVFGENSRSFLNYNYNKAKALTRLGKVDESLELLHHVHEKRVRMYGETDARTLWCKFEIAAAHYEKEEFTKALKIWEEVEAGYSHVFGDAHPHTTSVRNKIADCKAELSVGESSQPRLICNLF